MPRKKRAAHARGGPDLQWLMGSGADAPEFRINRSFCGFQAVPPQWQIPPRIIEHEHLFWLVIHSSCEGHVDDERVRVDPGCLLWIPPGRKHAFWHVSKDDPITIFHFRGAIFQRGRRVSVRQPYHLQSHAWSLRPILEQIVDELRVGMVCFEARMQGLMLMMFSELYRLLAVRREDARMLSTDQCSRLARFVSDNIAERVEPSDLAAELRLSHDYFTRLFRRTFGVTPRTWVMQERIRRAATVLAESLLTAKEVARMLGYEDIYLFSRQFRQVMGQGPRAWRSKGALRG